MDEKVADEDPKAKGLWTDKLEFLNNYDRNVYEEDERREKLREEKRRLRLAQEAEREAKAKALEEEMTDD